MIKLCKILRKCFKNKIRRTRGSSSRARRKECNASLQFSGREGNNKKSIRYHGVFFLGREIVHHQRTEGAIAHDEYEEVGDKKSQCNVIHNQIRHQNPKTQKSNKFLLFSKVSRMNKEIGFSVKTPTKSNSARNKTLH